MMKAALFDLDGVVFDTEPLYTKFWEQLGKNLHLPYDNFANVIKGMTLVEIFERYFPEEELQKRIRHEVEQYEHEMNYAYVPGSKWVLNELRQRGVRMAIVTSSDMEKMKNVYRQHPELFDSFDLILTAEDFERGKPAPDCYLTAMQRLGVGKDECVVFEDSFNGIKAGKNAGIKVIGVATTNPRELLQPVCDTVIESFENITIDELMNF